ncbi:MAG: ABC transporter permease [Treponema sp.]|nr:ABC transporter permease [Treponema sp.]
MKKYWAFFVASRYIFKGRSSSPVLAVLGIAVGVLALIVIIAVMNGFQLGFIESILEVSSYHIRVESLSDHNANEIIDAINEIPGVKAVVPYKEFQALARGRRSGQQAVIIRGLYENTLEVDELLNSKLEFVEGNFDISNTSNALLGAELARRLNLGVGDNVTLFSLTGILSAEDEAGVENFVITGIFRTGYYEYDCTWGFLNIEKIPFLDNESELVLGVKIQNRFHDRILMEQTKKKLSGYEGLKISSWRDYNRSFFGALRTEKLFMFILVGLIFIVVGLNIYQAQRRSVLHRREEIGLLRAVGASKGAVQFVFIFDGGVIGFTGAFFGLVIGLLIEANIQAFFSKIEDIVNVVIKIINKLADYLGAGIQGNFYLFSPAIFYIKEIPSRILVQEVIIIFMFGFLSALFAAWFASGKIAKIRPAEVLRYE